MKLEDIGFYTLSDDRAIQASPTSPMWRCELILSDKCNFKCPYCRGLKPELRGTLPLSEAKRILDLWAETGLKNVRFSGGEPTLYPDLRAVVMHARSLGVERIAMSTNGSADLEFYLRCIAWGINDFSISLDACCSDFGKRMCGGIPNMWERVVENIECISEVAYVSLGMVFTEDTVGELAKTVEFGHGLGVADIRVISAAQYNRTLEGLKGIPQSVLDAHPILKYRVNNALAGRNVRGVRLTDSHRCNLVMDDSAVAGKWHFPCIIYMREGGAPIGEVGHNMRAERMRWMENHDTHTDPICQKNCLDVCIDYNNRFRDITELGVRDLSIDPAFGMLTRPALERRLGQLQYPLSAILLDLNDLHNLNAKHGYEEVNRMVRAALYPARNLMVGRWFVGDEIIIITPTPKETVGALTTAFRDNGLSFKYVEMEAKSCGDLKDCLKGMNVRFFGLEEKHGG